jgi:hypothetical protein
MVALPPALSIPDLADSATENRPMSIHNSGLTAIAPTLADVAVHGVDDDCNLGRDNMSAASTDTPRWCLLTRGAIVTKGRWTEGRWTGE